MTDEDHKVLERVAEAMRQCNQNVEVFSDEFHKILQRYDVDPLLDFVTAWGDFEEACREKVIAVALENLEELENATIGVILAPWQAWADILAHSVQRK